METIKALLVDLQAQKNMQHLFAMLQGLIGFVSAVGGKDPWVYLVPASASLRMRL